MTYFYYAAAFALSIYAGTFADQAHVTLAAGTPCEIKVATASYDQDITAGQLFVANCLAAS